MWTKRRSLAASGGVISMGRCEVGRAITLLYFDGCPNWQVAKERLEVVLRQLGKTGTVRLERVETPQEAEELDFRGSPTILIDGKDAFEAIGPTGLSCRVYRTDAGLEGAPSVEQLLVALKESS